jgi:hypothetical protein
MIRLRKNRGGHTAFGSLANRCEEGTLEAEKLSKVLWKLAEAYDLQWKDHAERKRASPPGVCARYSPEADQILDGIRKLARQAELLFKEQPRDVRVKAEAKFAEEAKGRK